MSRISTTAIISRVKQQYTPAVSNSTIVAVVGPGQHIHDVEAERRPGICPGIVLPHDISTQLWGCPASRAKRGRSWVGDVSMFVIQ